MPLQNNWVQVKSNGSLVTNTYAFTPGSNIEHNVNWSSGDASNVRYHVSKVHDYFKNTFSYNAMDYQMSANVNAGSGVNGQADGTSISFGSQGGEYWARSSDVVYHEYTHDVIHHIYGGWIGIGTDIESHSMDEGLSDYYTCTINNNSVQGESVDVYRHLNNNYTFDPSHSGPYHWNGQVIGGTCWDVREAMSTAVGDNLVFRALQIAPHAHTYSDFLQNMRVADNNYYSGSYDSQITTAFANHGISLPAPPPLSVSISGPTEVQPYTYPTWTANPSGGSSPYQYYWEINVQYRSGGSSGWSYFGNQQSESRTYDTSTYTAYYDQSPYTTSLTDPTPNPFNPTTVLKYSLAKPAHVKLMIYNILGQQVATLVDANQAAGKYRKTFNASQLSSGTYLERMIITDKSGKVTQLTKKLLLMK